MSGWIVTLIVLGLMVLGIVLLTLALMTLAGRARPLRRAARRLSWRAEEAQRLQVKAMAVQDKVTELQAGLAEAQAKAATRMKGRDTGV